MRHRGSLPIRSSRATVCGGLLGLVALVFVPAAAAPTQAAQIPAAQASDAQRLVFRLEYVGTDYGAAVRDGEVINQLEYGEMLRLTEELLDGYRTRPDAAPAVATGLAELQTMVRQRAPGVQVWEASRRLLPQLAGSLAVSLRPQRPPSLANGRRLWASDCAPCHGPTGAGDDPVAAHLDPPPTAFVGERLDHLSPHQVFNALTFGVDGTAMPSFGSAYRDEDRWDVAFFLMTLRGDFTPRRPQHDLAVSLDELSARANVELLRALRQRWPDTSLHEIDWLRANPISAIPPTAAAAAPPAAAMTDGVATAVQLQDAFGRVAERVMPRVVGVTGYVRDPAWSLQQLQTERGDAWMVANADALRYPGFRPIHTGSGLLMDADYVISCNHLIRDERGEVVPLVDVELHNQTHVATGVVGSEPTLDLAILHFAPPTSDAPPELALGDSDRLQVGNWVIALGDPPGPEKVFAVGVVSAPPERQCYQEQRSATLLQSSLVIGAGGLGGPVVDIFGQVVGINTGIGQVDGLLATADSGAALSARTLPVNLALNLFEALKVAQSQRSPWLGVSVLELPLIRRRLGPAARNTIFPQTGVYIDDVFAPSPAAQAGVRPGDFLVALGGHQLLSVADFQMWLYVLGIGTPAELDLLRDGQRVQVVARIEVRPDAAAMR